MKCVMARKVHLKVGWSLFHDNRGTLWLIVVKGEAQPGSSSSPWPLISWWAWRGWGRGMSSRGQVMDGCGQGGGHQLLIRTDSCVDSSQLSAAFSGGIRSFVSASAAVWKWSSFSSAFALRLLRHFSPLLITTSLMHLRLITSRHYRAYF